MPTRKITFVEDEIYHICNRSVEGRKIFVDAEDHYRAIHDLYEFNDEESAENVYYRMKALKSYETRSHKITQKKKKPLVEILAYVLMPNHYHLLLRQLLEGGITNFMHKFGVGFAMYFNQKYSRTGTLFQGPFRAVHVKETAHFIHLPFYIHANPLDLKFPEWRDGKIRNPPEAMKYLENYRWSSFPDYIGKHNFPSVISKSFLTDVVGGPKEYRAKTMELLKELNLTSLEEVALESLRDPVS